MTTNGLITLQNVGILVCVTILIILFAGDPDLMDGIVSWLMSE